MSCDTEIDEFLKDTHTRLLLAYRDQFRIFESWGGDPTTDGMYTLPEGLTIDQVKTELATREHIPNKIEAKAIRKQKAKEKKHR